MDAERRSDPITTLKEAQKSIQAEAERLIDKSKAYFESHPDLVGDELVAHSDGATSERMAVVYTRTSEQIGAILLQHKRDVIRAMNPYFSRLSDEEVDKIVTRYDSEETAN